MEQQLQASGVTVDEIKKAKLELSKKLNTLFHDFVKETGIVPCAEISAKTEEKLYGERMQRVSVYFDIKIKVWL